MLGQVYYQAVWMKPENCKDRHIVPPRDDGKTKALRRSEGA